MEKNYADLFVRIPIDLHKKLKIQAINENKSITELLTELIKNYLKVE